MVCVSWTNRKIQRYVRADQVFCGPDDNDLGAVSKACQHACISKDTSRREQDQRKMKGYIRSETSNRGRCWVEFSTCQNTNHQQTGLVLLMTKRDQAENKRIRTN